MNCCSIRNKTQDILLDAWEQESDVVFLTETWLHTNEKALQREFEEGGYTLVHKSRGAAGGGVGVPGAGSFVVHSYLKFGLNFVHFCFSGLRYTHPLFWGFRVLPLIGFRYGSRHYSKPSQDYWSF